MTGTLHEALYYYAHLSYLPEFSLEWELSHSKAVGKIKTQFLMFSNFISEYCLFYEIMWKIYGRAGQATNENIIRRMNFAYWIYE